MSRPSIFDRLSWSESDQIHVESPDAGHIEYREDLLRVLDGIALTSAGFIAREEPLAPDTPRLSPDLLGPDGYHLLVHEIADVQSGLSSNISRYDAKAGRLNDVILTLLPEALMLLENLPEQAAWDLIVSVPMASPEATMHMNTGLRQTLESSPYAEAMGDIYLVQPSKNVHHLMASSECGSNPYVLWISADSLVNEADIQELQERRLLGLSSGGGGLHPGEAAAALLVQRLSPVDQVFDSGWWWPRTQSMEHGDRDRERERAKRQRLSDQLANTWAWCEAKRKGVLPDKIVIDSAELPGRAVEVAGALYEHWPDIDVFNDGVGIDALCGFPGEAVDALMMTCGLAMLNEQQSALLLHVMAHEHTRIDILLACRAKEPAPEAAHS